MDSNIVILEINVIFDGSDIEIIVKVIGGGFKENFVRVDIEEEFKKFIMLSKMMYFIFFL